MTKLFFPKSDPLTIGVEIELQILDPISFDLVPKSETLLKICRKKRIERVKAEIHQSMLEIDSEVSSDVKECRSFLEQHIMQLMEVTKSVGLELGITGTHPFQQWADRLISRQNRYQYLHRKFQWLARRMNVYGVHVHVGMLSGDHALAISRKMSCYLPHLLALSANSPFWQGIDTGMQSSRVSVIETFPFSGIPLHFSGWHSFERYFNTLHKTGAIQSTKDLYWYIRPSLSYGTLEFRICDGMSTLSETMAVVALIHCLAAKFHEIYEEDPIDDFPLPEYSWIAPHNLWIAARDGLDGIIIADLNGKTRKISEEILELIELLSDIAKRLHCVEELAFIKQIIANGNGAQKQREAYHQGLSLPEIVALSSQTLHSDLVNSSILSSL